MKNNYLYRSSILLAGMLATGCGYQHGEQFYAEGTPRATGAMAQSQTAAGAKEDAMLYDFNFHGDQLNSLGQSKLNLILHGTPDGDPVMVYLNMPHDEVAARQIAVNNYLKAAGVKDTKMIVAEGPNLNQSHPSSYNIQKVYKKDGEIFDGEMAKEETTTSGGGMSPGGGGGH